jgi:hypothetical protein
VMMEITGIVMCNYKAFRILSQGRTIANPAFLSL